MSSCTPPRAGCQTKSQTHAKKIIYCGVPQCRNALQPCILVRVGVGVKLWAWTTLQPYKTNLPTKRNCLQQRLSSHCSIETFFRNIGGGGAVKKSVTIFCLPEKGK